MNQHLELKAQPGIIQPRRRASDQPKVGKVFMAFALFAVCPPAWVLAVWAGGRIIGWFGEALEMSSGIAIGILAIPHSEQRYDTSGDWFDVGSSLLVRVSAELPRREQFLVAIHELIEAFLCECKGITAAEVDAFDMHLEGEQLSIEPGDSPSAPYYRQHQLATGIERVLAAEAEVNWLEYERHVKELSR